MKIIESTNNTLIKKFRSLSVKKYREQFSLLIVEGEKVSRESLKYSALVDTILINIEFREKYLDIIENNSDKVILLTADVYKSLSMTIEPQNIMVVCRYINHRQDELTANKVLVLDRLQDPGNLGTIIRSAVASGFEDIVLIDSVDPYNDKTIRSASGTIFFPKFYKISTNELIEFTTKNGYDIIVAEAGKKSIFDSDLVIPEKFMLVVGNEGNGVSKEVTANKSMSISIPMDIRVESLNAGVSASILMFLLANKK